jgi:ATP-dependent Lon protease
VVGIVTGLAWTALGGATLPVEATRVHTLIAGFKLTGKLGEVMRESAEIAYSYAMSHLTIRRGSGSSSTNPSCTCTCPRARRPRTDRVPASRWRRRCCRWHVARRRKAPLAMTGELTLTGQVLAVGGIREKVIAARRVGIGELVLPEANRKDFTELPAYLREGLEVHFAKRYDDVFRVVFAPP